jgi:hypothetical protein
MSRVSSHIEIPEDEEMNVGPFPSYTSSRLFFIDPNSSEHYVVA